MFVRLAILAASAVGIYCYDAYQRNQIVEKTNTSYRDATHKAIMLRDSVIDEIVILDAGKLQYATMNSETKRLKRLQLTALVKDIEQQLSRAATDHERFHQAMAIVNPLWA